MKQKKKTSKTLTKEAEKKSLQEAVEIAVDECIKERTVQSMQ